MCDGDGSNFILCTVLLFLKIRPKMNQDESKFFKQMKSNFILVYSPVVF